MRTKTLLAAAAMLAAGLASSVAQSNVYSLNVVGYVNKILNGGGRYTAVANPLNTSSNTLQGLGLITYLPNNSQVLKWNRGTSDFDIYVKSPFGAWPSGAAAVTLNVGEGILVYVTAPTLTNTFVGEVLQGSLTNALPLGYQMVGNMVPDAGATISAVGLVPPNNSQVLRFDSTNGLHGDWAVYTKSPFGSWGATGEPGIGVAEALMVKAGSATNWVRNFTVQ